MGRKKMPTWSTSESWAHKFLSVALISTLIYGKKNGIHNGSPVPSQYKEDIQELYTFLEGWITRFTSKHKKATNLTKILELNESKTGSNKEVAAK